MRLKFVIVFATILLVAGCIDKETGIQIDKNTTTDIDKNTTTDIDKNTTTDIDKNIGSATSLPVDTITEPAPIDTITGPAPIDTIIKGSSESGNTPTRTTDTPIISSKTAYWCKIGESIDQGTGIGKLTFKIKGLATYKGKEVCMAESSTEDLKLVYLFNKENSYRIILATDPNGNTDEINLNS